MAYNRRHVWTLKIRKDDKTMICNYYSGGSAAPGGFQNPVVMEFEPERPVLFYQGAAFASEKQAMWFWSEWCKRRPEETAGWIPEPTEYEA